MPGSPAFFALDTSSLPWELRENPHLPAPIFRKVLHTDPETGVFFQLVRYPRGVVNPDHTHPCAHAMYVLDGTLLTHKERHADGSVHAPAGPVTFTQTLDATAVVIALQKAGKWTDEPTVTLEPLTPVPRKGAEDTHAARARESAERAKMSYKRILLTIVPRSGPSPLR